MQSETIGAVAAALAKAQGEIRPAPMDRDNPFFKSKYATLTSLWESARAALSANGLAVTQVTDFADGEIVLITTLLHSSGEWIGGVYPVRSKDGTPQALGSALTYARRYAFGALVGLTSDDDDDGNAATNGATNGGAQHTNKPAAGGAKSGTTPATPANGSAPAAKPFPAVSPAHLAGDALAPTAEHKRFHAAGAKLYGQDWDAKRHEIVKAYTKGRTESSKELTADELVFLTDRMDAKLQAELDAINVKSAEAIPA